MASLGVLRDPHGHLEDKAALDQPTATFLGSTRALDVAAVRDLAAWPADWTARDVFGRVTPSSRGTNLPAGRNAGSSSRSRAANRGQA